MAESVMRRLVVSQRKRLVASLLGAAEDSPWWNRLSRDEQLAYREKVLDATGVYHDLILDIIKVGTEDVVVNDHAVELIEQIHGAVSRLSRG